VRGKLEVKVRVKNMIERPYAKRPTSVEDREPEEDERTKRIGCKRHSTRKYLQC
jgi:hypothetical protein